MSGARGEHAEHGAQGEHDLVELITADVARAEAVALELQSRGVTALVFPGAGGWTIAGPNDRMMVMVPRGQLDAAREYLAHENDPKPVVPKADDAWKWPNDCQHCGYSLRGLQGVETCPECGKNVFIRGRDTEIVELINTDGIRAHAIAAELESAGIEVRVHELRGLQAETSGWRVFVFGRDVARARRVLVEGADEPASLIGECPACGHKLTEPASRCPDCGLSLATPGTTGRGKGNGERPGEAEENAADEPGAGTAILLAVIFGTVFVVAVILLVLRR